MTVAVLTLGLLAVGAGTMVSLYNAQVAAIDDQITEGLAIDVPLRILEVDVEDGVPRFSVREQLATSFHVAVYQADGKLMASADGSDDRHAAFPETWALEDTVLRATEPLTLPSRSGSTEFHASTDVLQIPGVRGYYTQMVALPLTPADRAARTFVGIYTAFAAVTILVAALATRWLVTLAFRSLGQVENTAMSIAAGDFGQRMGDISPRTEVGKLKTAINTMLDRVDTALSQRDATVRQMRRFIGDASHELRTPLVTVRGYAELHRMGALSTPEQTTQAMDRIEKEAIRMGLLVEDLLALARLDERRDLAVAEVDLRVVGRDAALDAHAATPERTISFVDESTGHPHVLTAPAEEQRGAVKPAPRRPKAAKPGAIVPRRSLLRRKPRADGTSVLAPLTAPISISVPLATVPVVWGDENRIRQVVANLLGNARRYTPEGSPVEVTVAVDAAAGMGVIRVVDHGEGVPEQIREKIFQRFWRADTSRTRETGGSGLGLSIVASIVEALHGTIEVTETHGGGATFSISLPLVSARPPEEHLLIETQPIQKIRSI